MVMSKTNAPAAARVVAAAILLACAGSIAAPPAFAQFMGEPGGGPAQEGTRRGPAPRRTGPAAPRLTPKPLPRQRLDAGALLCPTEDDLHMHEAAIEARLDGRDAPEPAGCRFVRSSTAVSVMDRHGPAATQVRLPGDPELVGWTDAIVQGEAAPAK